MILLLDKLPRKVTVALSGGIDSMVLLDFLSRKHEIDAAFFDHGTHTSKLAKEFVIAECDTRGISLNIGSIGSSEKHKTQSPEEFWREKRYEFLKEFAVVVTAHHLDDVLETWLWSCAHGTPSLMPYQRDNVYRPFLLNKKCTLQEWAKTKNVRHIEDHTNNDTKYTRNYIRAELVPSVLRVNPGIHTMLRKKLIDRHKKVPNMFQ